MAQNSFALMTNLGRAKEAEAIANGTAIVITHIAIGDGTTVPSGGETQLYNEVARKAISGHGTVVGASNVAYFDIFLSASEGPYTIREAGLYDDDGDLIAIARYDPPINKPVPSSGQTIEGTVRLEVAFSNIASVTIIVDPSFVVPLQRLSRLPWVSVISMTVAAPPATPGVGDTYLVPSGATGAWAGQAGKIAEYTAAGWAIIAPTDGHGISLPDGRVYERVAGSYVEKIALDSQSGKWNYAVAGGSANAITASVTPAPSALVAGLALRLRTSAANTGATTLNLNGLGAKPVVYNETGAALLGKDWSNGSVIDLVYDGARWRTELSLGFFDNRYAQLTVPPSNTFYVVGPSGNDNNSGLANTAADGFATIQGAVTAIANRYITLGTVTINVADGSYNGVIIPASFVSGWRIRGNDASPNLVAIWATDAGGTRTRGLIAQSGVNATVSGMEFRSYYENVSAASGSITISKCNFNAPTRSGTPMLSAYGGSVTVLGDLKMTGSCSACLMATRNGSITVGYSDDSSSSPVVLTFSNVTVSSATVVTTSGASISFVTSVVTMQGSVTGRRYAASTNGTILTLGSGENYIPGTTAGQLSSGGQYT